MIKFGIEYKNIKSAINLANHFSKGKALCSIGWNSKTSKWIIYTTCDGCKEGIRPEFLCIGSGFIPIPLSSEGRQIFEELFCKGV